MKDETPLFLPIPVFTARKKWHSIDPQDPFLQSADVLAFRVDVTSVCIKAANCGKSTRYLKDILEGAVEAHVDMQGVEVLPPFFRAITEHVIIRGICNTFDNRPGAPWTQVLAEAPCIGNPIVCQECTRTVVFLCPSAAQFVPSCQMHFAWYAEEKKCIKIR